MNLVLINLTSDSIVTVSVLFSIQICILYSINMPKKNNFDKKIKDMTEDELMDLVIELMIRYDQQIPDEE